MRLLAVPPSFPSFPCPSLLPSISNYHQTTEPDNPIMQDTDEITDEATGEVVGEKLRYYLYGGSRGNYGGIPQTWEHSNRTDNMTGFIGDNDPVDFLDIGAARAPIGGVYRAKVRGWRPL
jgi:hypothetical protein